MKCPEVQQAFTHFFPTILGWYLPDTRQISHGNFFNLKNSLIFMLCKALGGGLYWIHGCP
jgi:hypothetical protein